MRVGTANTDFARRGDPKYLDFLTEKADVLGLQEAKDVVLRDHLPDGWVAYQPGALSLDRARMGSPVTYDSRKYRCVERYQVLGCKPFWLGKRIGMLTRWITVIILEDRDTGERVTAISAHNAPWRFRFLQPRFKKNLKAEVAKHRRWVVCTDANEPLTTLAKYLDGRAYGQGIVGLVSNVRITNVKIRHWGQGHGFTDHPAVTGKTA